MRHIEGFRGSIAGTMPEPHHMIIMMHAYHDDTFKLLVGRASTMDVYASKAMSKKQTRTGFFIILDILRRWDVIRKCL